MGVGERYEGTGGGGGIGTMGTTGEVYGEARRVERGVRRRVGREADMTEGGGESGW